MSNSVFTLCPAGYGRWTFRFIEALENSSIPIIISDGYILPFSDEIAWENYVIRIKECDIWNLQDFVFGISVGTIYEKLNNITSGRHIFKKENVLRLTAQALLKNMI